MDQNQHSTTQSQLYGLDDLKAAARLSSAMLWRILRPAPALEEAREDLIEQAVMVGVNDALIVKQIARS